MLRLYLLQNLYDLSDMDTMESSSRIPDGGTLRWFHSLLEKRELQEKFFSQVVELLQEKGLMLKKGTIVNSAITKTPTSTRNLDRKRDPDVHSTRKGNT